MKGDAVCPLCRKDCKHRDHIRSHLHVHHQKSEIIDEYLENAEEEIYLSH